MNIKYILFLILFFTLSAGIKAQTYKEHRANIYFDRFNFNKAIELYTVVVENDPENYLAMQKLAKSHKYISNDTAAARYYKLYFDGGKPSNDDLFDYAMVLKNTGDYNASNELLKEYTTFIKKENYLLTEEQASVFSRKSLLYKVSLVEASSPASDFSPAYFGNKIIFVSSRQGTNIIRPAYERDGQAFLQLYLADKGPGGQLVNVRPFDSKFKSRVHEGPVSFCAVDSIMYFTRNNFKIIKGKSFDDQVKLKIYYSKFSCKGNSKSNAAKEANSKYLALNKEMCEGHWGKVQDHRLNRKDNSTGHPSVSKDGTKMYFASDMHDGKGGTDIYVSTRIGKDDWSAPTNVSEINTAGNEMFPFIHESGVLYFASDGLPGIGGLDIFKATKEGQKFGIPVNLKAPINSVADDFGLIADANTKEGYFSSNRENGKGSDDLYHIEFIDRPEFTLAGVVSDSDTKKPLSKASVKLLCNESGEEKTIITNDKGQYSFVVALPDTYELNCSMANYSASTTAIQPQSMQITNDTIFNAVELDMYGVYGYVHLKGTDERVAGVKVTISDKSDKSKVSLVTNEKGEFKQVLKPDTDYALFFDKDEYFIVKDQYSTKDQGAGWVNLNETLSLAMDKMEVGKTIEIPNIYYDVAKWNIRTDAAIELDKVVEFMADNPTIKIESHTDARGGYKTNQRLSQKRAESAVTYIVESGIDKSRIKAKGYGESKIKNRCKNGVQCNDLEHQENRRTEIKITSI